MRTMATSNTRFMELEVGRWELEVGSWEFLPEPGLHALKLTVPRTELLKRQLHQRGGHGVALSVHVLRVRRDIEKPGDDLAVLLTVADVGVGTIAVAWIVILSNLAKPHPAPVVHHHAAHAAGFVTGG